MTHDPNDPELLKAALAQALDRERALVEALRKARSKLTASEYIDTACESNEDEVIGVLNAALDQSGKGERR